MGRDFFTFQSGDIQINKFTEKLSMQVTFTFQSGDIQMKCVGDSMINASFTFQSGDIQINTSV